MTPLTPGHVTSQIKSTLIEECLLMIFSKNNTSFFHLSQNERICLKFLPSLHERVKQEPHTGVIKVSHLVNFLISNLSSPGALKRREKKEKKIKVH